MRLEQAHLMHVNSFGMFTLSVEFNFDPFTRVVSEEPPMCHHGDTMCQIKNRIPKCTSVGNFKGSRKISAI